MATIDLNADLGEGFGVYRMPADAELLTLVSSANVACGFHAGDPLVMAETVALAARHDVAVGAHPSYPDLLGFGRREMTATPAEVRAYVIYQIGALAAFCQASGLRLRYVKPHGALYNRAARDAEIATAIAEAVRAVDPSLWLLGLAGGELVRQGRALGLAVAAEAFVDRAYRADGTLVPRTEPQALIDDADIAIAQALSLVREGRVSTVDGGSVMLGADSLCVHGDTPGALALVRRLRERLVAEGITVAPFVHD